MEHKECHPVNLGMSDPADRLRGKVRQTRFLARQALTRTHAEALHGLASMYEEQAAQLEALT